jgi:hypothetical protein
MKEETRRLFVLEHAQREADRDHAVGVYTEAKRRRAREAPKQRVADLNYLADTAELEGQTKEAQRLRALAETTAQEHGLT